MSRNLHLEYKQDYSECGLTNEIVLRGEFGYNTWLLVDEDELDFDFVPLFTLEPRWYYNLKRRIRKNKKIDGNSGNYLSIKASFEPTEYIIDREPGIEYVGEYSIIPSWRLRRNLWKRLTYEVGFGA